MSVREFVFQYVTETYKAKPEYLWARFPEDAIFRHADNRKWFALVMRIRYDKLEAGREGMIDILNVKLDDPLLRDLLVQQEGYYVGYHISRGNWISIVLDGTVPTEEITRLIGISYTVTAPKPKKQTKKTI